MQKIHTYTKAGSYFGEKALDDANKLRLATVICETDCHLAYLTKADYLKLMAKHEARRLAKNIELLE